MIRNPPKTENKTTKKKKWKTKEEITYSKRAKRSIVLVLSPNKWFTD